MVRNSARGVFLTLVVFGAMSAFGEKAQLSQDDQKALQETQDLLRDQKQRDEYIKSSPDAQKTMDQVKTLGGSQQNMDAMFNISADIFQSLVNEAGGDPVKLQMLLAEAQKNPEKFFNKLSAQQKENIRKVAGDIEKTKAPVK
jgi:hypothetical protein